MRTLDRNKETIYYRIYSGKTAVVDENGLKTGEYAITYGNPTSIRVSVSPAKGTANTEMFGTNVDYSKTLVMDSCPFNENAILYIGITPTQTQGVWSKHNYIVKRIAKGLTNTVVAVKEVEVG